MEKSSTVFRKVALVGLLGIGLAIAVPIYLKSKKYPIDLAAEIMSDYLSLSPTGDLARKNHFGGVFPAELFEPAIDPACVAKGDCGIALWFCIDPQDKFYIALEKQTWDYQKNNLPDHPSTETYYRARNVFNFPAAMSADPRALEAYLRNHPTGKDATCDTLDKATVIAGIDKFKQRFGGLCRFNFSFIAENNDGDLKDCIKKAGDQGHLKYYFGFEKRGSWWREMPNKMRIILVAANSNGENQVNTAKNVDDPILQSSWPPPPY